jgi:hypothetical protein
VSIERYQNAEMCFASISGTMLQVLEGGARTWCLKAEEAAMVNQWRLEGFGSEGS